MKTVVIISLILSLLIISGCNLDKDKEDEGIIKNIEGEGISTENNGINNKEDPVKDNNGGNIIEPIISNKTDPDLTDFQIAACTSAHEHETCSELEALPLVTEEECCDEMKLCCKE